MALSDLLQQAHFEMMSVNASENVASHPACILFFSLSDGKQRAYTHISTGNTFNQAWTSGSQFIQRYRQKHDLQVCWLRVERVDHIEEMSWAALQEKLGKTKRNYFRFGLSFDPKFTHAILEHELAANAILYDGKVGVATPNATNLESYAQRRFSCSLSWPTDPQQTIWRFKTQAVFCDASGAKTIEREGKESGFRKIVEPWQTHVPTLIHQSAQYLATQIKASGEYHYGWFPCFDRKIKSYNALRHASSTYALIEGWEVTQQPQQRQAIDRALAYLTDELIQHKTLANGRQAAFLVDVGDEIKLGGNAVSILAYAKYTEVTGDRTYLPLMEALAEGILLMQDEQGKFVHVLENQDLSVKEPFRIIYYDGEAAFALMRLYKLSPQARWIESVERAFEYFIENKHWQFHDHWLSYCVNELTLYRPLDKYFKFGLDNVRDHLDFIRHRVTTYPTLLELMMAANAMIDRIHSSAAHQHLLQDFPLQQFSEALEYRARYLLNGFFWPELAMFFKNPARIVNSFFIRHHSYRVRIDDVEHYLSGYVAYANYYAQQQQQQQLVNVKKPDPHSRTPVFLLENLREVGNGIEVAALRRATLFCKQLQRTPWIVTLQYNPSLLKTLDQLRERGRLPVEVTVKNLYLGMINCFESGKVKALPGFFGDYKPQVEATETCPLGKRSYRLAQGTIKVDDFVDRAGNVLLRRHWHIHRDMWQLTHIEVHDSQQRLFNTEEQFATWAIEKQLPRTGCWHFIIDKNRAWRDFVLSAPRQRMDCQLSAVIHSSHLLGNGQIKASYRHLLESPDCVNNLIILTQEQHQDLCALGVPAESMQVIPNHLEEAILDANIKKIPSKRVVYLARYSPEKQHALLLEVFEQVLRTVPDAELYTYGVGGLQDELTDLVKKKGLNDSVKINGYTADIAAVHQQACCAVLCSNQEGHPLSAIEAMAFGTPLVSFAIKYGPRDILLEQNAGLLVNAGDKEAMAAALIRVLQDPELQTRLQSGAKACAQRYSSSQIAAYWRHWLHVSDSLSALNAQQA